MDANRPRLSELQCCFIQTAAAALLQDGLDVPELQYPSAGGEWPICHEKEFITAYVDPMQGVTEYQPRPGELVTNDPKCAFRRQVIFVLDVGLCKTFVGKTETDNCGGLLGSCGDKDTDGRPTYARDAARSTDYLDCLTSIAGAVMECFCAAPHPDGLVDQWTSTKPRLTSGVVLAGAVHNTIRTKWSVAL